MKTTPSIGQLIENHIANHKISKASLARALKISQANLAARLKNPFPSSKFVLNLSQTLRHNFFADIAATLPADFSTNVAATDAKDEKIAALEQELKILERERDMLKDILGRKINE